MTGKLLEDDTSIDAISTTNSEDDLHTSLPAQPSSRDEESKLLYEIDQVPPWCLTIFLAFQHCLTMMGATVVTPYLLSPSLCIGPDDPARAHIISTIIFVSGITSFVQTTFGVRLPIIHGSAITYTVPTLVILSLPKWKCPENLFNDVGSENVTWTQEEKDSLWQERICEIQGCILVVACLEAFFGFSGLAGCLLRFITPLAMTPIMTLVGLALFDRASDLASKNWGVAILTIVLVVTFAEYLGNRRLPFGSYSKDQGCHVVQLQIFKLLPVLFSIILTWTLCGVLTAFDVFPATDPARTDLNGNLITAAPWVRVPYPGQWGMPTVSLSGVFGMLGALLATMIGTVGNYYACARLSGVSPPPIHAINRGIFVEGLGSMLTGMFGTADGTSSYAENLGIIGVTKVASRRVIQIAALMMVIFGMVSKFGAVFVSMPQPIVGGIFFIVFSIITSVGLANLKYVDFNAPRTLIVAGLPLFCGLAIPKWVENNKESIATGVLELDNVIQVLLSTSMFVGGFLGFLLDNTVPGTPEERGLLVWTEETSQSQEDSQDGLHCYNLPFGMDFLRKSRIARFIPISPSFDPTLCSCRRRTSENKALISDVVTVPYGSIDVRK